MEKAVEVDRFEEIEAEFMSRIQQAIYCTVATVDLKNRPRLRMLHLVWDGPVGWVISWPKSHKAIHLAHNPAVSLAYSHDPYKPVYVECTAGWVEEPSEKRRIWELHKSIPAPLGFDPEPHYGSIDHPFFGLIRFIPWRIELGDLYGTPRVWRPHPGQFHENSGD
jgi:general stress protein 26